MIVEVITFKFQDEEQQLRFHQELAGSSAARCVVVEYPKVYVTVADKMSVIGLFGGDPRKQGAINVEFDLGKNIYEELDKMGAWKGKEEG